VQIQVDTAAIRLTFGCEVQNNTITAYFDGALAVEGEMTYTDFRDTNVYVREDDFDLSVQYSIGSFTVPRREGTIVQNNLVREGKLKIKFQIYNDTFSVARGIYDTIIKATTRGEKEMRFADDRIIKVKVSDISAIDYKADGRVFTFSITFIVPNPIQKFISAYRNKTNVSSSPTSYNFTVNGNYESFPRFYFLPPAGITISALTLENLTTGERFSYLTNVPPGATLFYDCEKSEVTLNGVDGLSYHTGDFPRVVPGVNYMKYTGTAGITILSDWWDSFL
jgi:phage-related protein